MPVLLLLSFAVGSTLAIFNKELFERQLFSFSTQDSNAFRIVMTCFAWLYFLFFMTLSAHAMKIKYKIGMPSTLRKYSGLGD